MPDVELLGLQCSLWAYEEWRETNYNAEGFLHQPRAYLYLVTVQVRKNRAEMVLSSHNITSPGFAPVTRVCWGGRRT
jgi:hypothetical protein